MKRNVLDLLGAVALLILATFLAPLAAVMGSGAEELRPDIPRLSPQQKIDLIIAQMAKMQKEARTITAEFTMEKKMALLASPVRAEGVLYVTKPDRIYWEVKEPTANTLIVNRDTLWMYYPTLRQVDKIDISGKRNRLARYLELSDDGSIIKENYKIQLLENPGEQGIFLLELLPKTSRMAKRVAKVRVWVDSGTWFFPRIDLWEPNGDYSSIRLKGAKLNAPIPDGVYHFKPPPGTTVSEPLKSSPPRSER
ncbi:MAG: outer membrane lipoprotein carrier protein LolA [candidate division NC10 bacterium]|nr:outer membrane lipoprotein carrier protein LolA [candidate division NC10 bacterium]